MRSLLSIVDKADAGNACQRYTVQGCPFKLARRTDTNLSFMRVTYKH